MGSSKTEVPLASFPSPRRVCPLAFLLSYTFILSFRTNTTQLPFSPGDRSSDYNPFTSPDLCGPDSGDECSPSGAAVWRTTTVGFGQPDVAAVVLTFTIDCSTTKDGQTSQLYLVDEVSLGAQH